MPIYEYQCPDCGHKFEKLQKVSDDPIRVCPECSGDSVRKLVSPTAFILKGSGWYKDHYGLKQTSGDGGGKEGAGSSGAGSSGAGSSGDGASSGGGKAGKAGGDSGGSGAGTAATTKAAGAGASARSSGS
ncbi:MAG: zinc ribbon domain-containing protein [Deltaproteobacteria bacterium]|nr:MAG: zinc ribbon domain-containing protein [Deltaproteobacteria bacterium]